MTGKRPRALTRTASVSQLGSGHFSQEFSPLPENPKEKLKPTIKEPTSAPRVVIGFDPKPPSCDDNGYERALGTKSAPSSPCYQEKLASPRSGLNSLLSRQWGGGRTSEGVGLGIVLHAPVPTCPSEEVKISILEADVERDHGDHIAIPVRDETSPEKTCYDTAFYPRRHSHPIPIQIPGSQSSFQGPNLQGPGITQGPGNERQGSHQAVARPVPWINQDALKVDRHDTFLLAPSPARSSAGESSYAALSAAATVHFLDECSFCKRQLAEGKDIFMYRGDKAFCSPECRSKQIVLDERSRNCSSSALKTVPGAPARRGRVAAASSAAAA